MRALREIRQITSDTITIAVPSAFRDLKVEIIVLPLDETEGTNWPQDFIARFSGCIPDFPDLPAEGAYEARPPL